MELLKHELFKILSRKAQLIAFFTLAAGYICASESYYKWYKTTSWERITTFPDQAGALFIGALILLAIAPVFTEEYSLGTDSLIICAKKGKDDIVRAKLLAACIFTVTASAAFFIINIAVNIAYGGLTGWDKRLGEYHRYTAGAFGINMPEYFIVGFLICAFASIAFAIFVLYLSAINKSILNVLLIGGSVFILPYFLNRNSKIFIVRIFKTLSYTELMRVDGFFTDYSALRLERLSINNIWFVMIFLAALSAILIKKIYKRFEKHQILHN